MRIISISDITMKHSEADRFTLSFREKIELAKQLDRLGVNVIEIDAVENVKVDPLLIKSLASAVKDAELAVPVSALDTSKLELTWNALKHAAKPRLQVASPVSTVQMEYFCHKKPAAMLEAIGKAVAACRALCPNVEFVAEDAGRSERSFLSQAIAAAIAAGATAVTVCDTAGTLLSEECYDSIASIRAEVSGDVRLGVRCSNELYMADACAMAAIRAGADEVKTAAYGEKTASLEKLARILTARGLESGVACGVHTTELRRAVGQISWLCENSSRGAAAAAAAADETANVLLTSHDDMPAVMKAVAALGYELGEEDSAKVYEAFQRIAGRKESVGAKELDAIVASAAMQVPPTYRLESYVINSGNINPATSYMCLKKNDQTLESVALGDGPVDASFRAIEQIAGAHYELDDFQIQSVTEGREAMGESVIRLRAGGKIYSGRGISTDVIGSSIRAYINALNKIVYEEGEA